MIVSLEYTFCRKQSLVLVGMLFNKRIVFILKKKNQVFNITILNKEVLNQKLELIIAFRYSIGKANNKTLCNNSDRDKLNYS